MKYLILGIVFVVMPYFLLTAFVKPSLESLQQVYGNVDAIAGQAAQTNIQEPDPAQTMYEQNSLRRGEVETATLGQTKALLR